MAQVALDVPFTLDPAQATRFVLQHATLDFVGNRMQVTVNAVNSSGTILQTKTVLASGAAVTTYLNNQASTILTRLLAQLGVTGTIS